MIRWTCINKGYLTQNQGFIELLCTWILMKKEMSYSLANQNNGKTTYLLCIYFAVNLQFISVNILVLTFFINITYGTIFVIWFGSKWVQK